MCALRRPLWKHLQNDDAVPTKIENASARPGRRRRTRLRMRRAPGNQRPKRVRPPGAVVLQVDPQSAAERAGLKPGDLVTELDGTPARDAADLQLRLALLRIGEVAEFAVSRDGGFRSSAWVFRSSASRSARNFDLIGERCRISDIAVENLDRHWAAVLGAQ